MDLRRSTHFLYGFDIFNDGDIIGQYKAPLGVEEIPDGTPVQIDLTDTERFKVCADDATPDYYLYSEVNGTILTRQRWDNGLQFDVVQPENPATLYIGGRGKQFRTKLIDETNGALSLGDEVGVLSGKYQLVDGTTVTNAIGTIIGLPTTDEAIIMLNQ